jgi:DNA replication and repair protein RecF
LITEARRRYVEQLVPVAAAVAARLLDLELVLSYRAGWAAGVELRSALEASFARDQDLGATQVGPHRADLSIRLQGASVRDRVSRGQQKLLAAVLLLAQIKLFPQNSRAEPTLLLDDPSAELDSEHLKALLEEVRAQPLQLIVTTLQPTAAELGVFGSPGRRFEIQGGAVQPV